MINNVLNQFYNYSHSQNNLNTSHVKMITKLLHERKNIYGRLK